MNATTEFQPILVVDLNYYRRNRIIDCCQQHGLCCTDEQARQLLTVVTLPDDPENVAELWYRLRNFFVIDPAAASPEVVEAQLRDLKERWKVAKGDDREQIERLMMNATDGLDEHPEWFDGACLCDTCKSYA